MSPGCRFYLAPTASPTQRTQRMRDGSHMPPCQPCPDAGHVATGLMAVRGCDLLIAGALWFYPSALQDLLTTIGQQCREKLTLDAR